MEGTCDTTKSSGARFRRSTERALLTLELCCCVVQLLVAHGIVVVWVHRTSLTSQMFKFINRSSALLFVSRQRISFPEVVASASLAVALGFVASERHDMNVSCWFDWFRDLLSWREEHRGNTYIHTYICI
jgi:hypothetical protein